MQFARTAGALGALGGAAGLVGWIADIGPLKHPLPTVASMKANTALALLLIGVSLWLTASGRRPRVATTVGVSVSVFALVTLSQYLLGLDYGIDQVLFLDTDAVATSSPGRMAPATAFSLAAVGISLAAAANQSTAWLIQIPALAAFLAAAVAALGYAYHVEALYGIGPYTTMAVHTSVALVLLSLGVLCSRPALGIMRPILSLEVEGAVTRRFLLAGTVVPIGVAWLLLEGQRAGLYRAEFGFALMALLTMVLLSVVSWRGAGTLEHLRQESESALRAANERLEVQVARQTKEIVRREREFRLVVEEAVDGFVAMNAAGRIVELNSRAETMFGWPRDEAMGQFVSELLIPARYREAHRQGLLGFVNGGPGPVLDREIEIEALHRDGHEFPVMLTISSVWFDHEWRFNAFIRDLTQAKAAEQLLMDTLSDKEMLLTEVHHRVKNNLQVISSFLRLQSRALSDSAASDALQQSEKRVLSMALLHEHLYRTPNLGHIDLAAYVSALTADLAETYGGGGRPPAIAIDVTLRSLKVETAVPLGLLLNKVITNALKHAFVDGRQGHISVHLSRHDGKGVLRVTDDGVGFPVSITDSPMSVGLQIIQSLSRQLGGRARFETDGGTRFVLEFEAA